MKAIIRKRLIHAALAITMGVAGGTAHYVSQPSSEVILAMELGSHFESSGRHIGKPYVDYVGKGQPLTVCNGVTGHEVVADKFYTVDDCKKLELPKYKEAEKAAKKLFKFWGSYNVWVKASIIDMIYNLGETAIANSTLLIQGNAGRLEAMCGEMPRWVRGTVNGRKVVLAGLVDRRVTTEELCKEWGRDGHFSAGLIFESQK